MPKVAAPLVFEGDTNLYRSSVDQLATDDSFYLRGTSPYLAFHRAAEGQPRFYIAPDGGHNWGDGTAGTDANLYRFAANFLGTTADFVARQGNAGQVSLQSMGGQPTVFFGSAQDTNLYRSAADTLKTDDTLSLPRVSFPAGGAGGDISFQGDTNLYRSAAAQLKTDGQFRSGTDLVSLAGDVWSRFGSASQVKVGDNGSGAPGVIFGSAADTNLFRHSAGNLRTNGSYVADAILYAGYTTTNGQVRIGAEGPASEAGLRFGSTSDVNLYRSAADNLKTDDTFWAYQTVTDKLYLGQANLDTYLFRTGAGVTACNGSFSAASTINAVGRFYSGGAGTGGIWVDGGTSQFFGSLSASSIGIYNGSWWLAISSTNGVVQCTNGVTAKVGTGNPTDSMWGAAPPDGTMYVDNTNGNAWIRMQSGVWKRFSQA